MNQHRSSGARRALLNGLMLLPLLIIACILLGPNVRRATAQEALPVELVTQTGHSQRIEVIAISPDARLALTGGQDNLVKLWDVRSGSELRQLRGHTGSITTLAFSPNGRLALSGSADQTLRLWDVTSGQELRAFVGHCGSVHAVAFSPDGSTALVGSSDCLRLWHIATGQQIVEFGNYFSRHGNAVTSVALSRDGSLALSGSADKTVKLWNVASGSILKTFTGHNRFVSLVAFSPDEQSVFSIAHGSPKLWDIATGLVQRDFGYWLWAAPTAISRDGRYVLNSVFERLDFWDLATGTLLRNLGGHTAPITAVAISPDGRFALSASENGTMLQWAMAPQAEPKSFQADQYSVWAVAVSPDSRLVLSGGSAAVKVWDVAKGEAVRTLPGGGRAVAFSPDGQLATSGQSNGVVKLWDLRTGMEAAPLIPHSASTPADRPWVSSQILAVAFSADGRFILSASDDGLFRVSENPSGKPVRSFFCGKSSGEYNRNQAVAFAAEGRFAITSNDGRKVTYCDVSNGKELHSFDASPIFVRALALSRDSRLALVEGGFGNLALYDLRNNAKVREFHGSGRAGRAAAMAFSLDDRYALSGHPNFDKNLVALWDINSGSLLQRLVGHTGVVNAVAFSPDGRFAVSGSSDKTIKIWPLTAAYAQQTFAPRAAAQSSAALSSDSSLALSVASDGFIVLWDVAGGRRIRRFGDPEGKTKAVAFLSNGKFAVTFHYRYPNGELKLWDLTTGKEVRILWRETVGSYSNLTTLADRRLLVLNTDDGNYTKVLFDADTGEKIARLAGGSNDSWNWNRNATNNRNSTVSCKLENARLFGILPWQVEWYAVVKDVSTLAVLRTIKLSESACKSIQLSPDGRRIAATDANLLWLWDIEANNEARPLAGHIEKIERVLFSSNGRRVLSWSMDGIAKLWDANTQQELRTIRKGTGVSIQFSSDGRLVLAQAPGAISIWDVEAGKERVRMLETPEGDWLALTFQGFFSASRRDMGLLSIVRGVDVLTIGQVHQSLFNPDLVREVMAGDPLGEVKRAGEIMNLEKLLESGPAPRVEIISHRSESRSTIDLIKVGARVTDSGKGVGRIEWRVGEVTTAVTKTSEPGPAHEVEQWLALDRGANKIEVIAYNGDNLLASLPARIDITFDGAADTIKPKLHVLAIGINGYIDKPWRERGRIRPGFSPLTLAVKDAESFAAGIQRAAGSLYEVMPPRLVLEKNATRDNIAKEIARMEKDISPRDTFILFAAAHGTSELGRFYLIPQDYQGAPGALQDRAIGQDQLQEWLANRIKAKKALILLDTCESGALIAGHSRSRTEEAASEASIGRLHEATGRPVLTAAAAGQLAREGLVTASGGRQGFFTHAILNALKHGDTNNNGTIELSELVAYVQDAVPKLAAQYGGAGRAEVATPRRAGQTARFGSRGEDFIVAARLP